MSAGKGDKPRNCFSKKYKSNYDSINCGNVQPCPSCKSNMKNIDKQLIALDSTDDKRIIGGNSTTAISLCMMNVGANLLGIEMFEYIRSVYGSETVQGTGHGTMQGTVQGTGNGASPKGFFIKSPSNPAATTIFPLLSHQSIIIS